METMLIVGGGYLGRRVAERLRREGRPVVLTAARESSTRALCELGYASRRLDLDTATAFVPPESPYRLLYLVPPPRQGGEDPRLPRLLAYLETNPPQRIVYAGSSAVYGDRKGAWVDETADVSPQSETGARRLHAENSLTRWGSRHEVSSVVLRLAGIYGPQRLPLERLRDARPVVRESEAGWSNRIHVDDLALACIAALQHAAPQSLYNIADGRPASTTAFLRALARRAGLAMPPELPLNEALALASPAQARFVLESRRLDVSRMRNDLLPKLLFPDFHVGLDSISEL